MLERSLRREEFMDVEAERANEGPEVVSQSWCSDFRPVDTQFSWRLAGRARIPWPGEEMVVSPSSLAGPHTLRCDRLSEQVELAGMAPHAP